MTLTLVSNRAGQNVANIRRSNPKYKSYIKYRASVALIQTAALTFREWLRDEEIFERRYYNDQQ